MRRELLVLLAATGSAFGARATAPSARPEPKRVLWEEGVKNAYPRWSKDGSRILFQSNRGGRWHLYVMEADGSHQIALTRGSANENFPDWSPDNSGIAFVSDRDGNEEVYVMDADGGGLRNLSNSHRLRVAPRCLARLAYQPSPISRPSSSSTRSTTGRSGPCSLAKRSG